MAGGLSALALLAGAAIAVQASMNARLGVLLGNSLLGASFAFFSSFLLTLGALVLGARSYPSISVVRAVPVHLWLSGVLSAFGVAMFYYLIPRMGVGAMMSYALTGQIVVAVVASHFGWFELPVRPVDALRIAGVAALISGIVLINWEGAA